MYVHKHVYIYAAATPTMFMGLATGLVLRTAVFTSCSAYHSAALSSATNGCRMF